MSILSTVHLNTQDAISLTSNAATFIVDWDAVLRKAGKTKGKCKISCKLRSNQQQNVGSSSALTINANFQSSFSNNTNGIVLATLEKKYSDPYTIYFVGRTKQNQGATIDIPTGQQLLNVIWAT